MGTRERLGLPLTTQEYAARPGHSCPNCYAPDADYHLMTPPAKNSRMFTLTGSCEECQTSWDLDLQPREAYCIIHQLQLHSTSWSFGHRGIHTIESYCKQCRFSTKSKHPKWNIRLRLEHLELRRLDYYA